MNKVFIDNWKQIPKMLSAWVAFACIGFSELLSPAQQIEVLRVLHIPEDKILGIVGILFLVSRALKQFSRPASAPPAPAVAQGSSPAAPTPPTDR